MPTSLFTFLYSWAGPGFFGLTGVISEGLSLFFPFLFSFVGSFYTLNEIMVTFVTIFLKKMVIHLNFFLMHTSFH